MNICVITTSSLLLLTKLHSTLKLHFGSVPSPVSQCLITSHSLPFHPVYTVITISNICELSFVTDLSVVVPSYILFLCYVHSSSCCIDNTSFVATTTATTINLFTPTSLHVVAPHCAVAKPVLCWSCWWCPHTDRHDQLAGVTVPSRPPCTGISFIPHLSYCERGHWKTSLMQI